MLQQQKDCQKKIMIAFIVGISIIGFIVLVPFSLFLIIWLVFFSKVKGVDIVLNKFGLTECLQGHEGIIEKLRKIEGTASSIKMDKQKNKKNEEKVQNKSNILYKEETKTRRNIVSSGNSRKYKSDSNIDPKKSIWDDYESVIDKF